MATTRIKPKTDTMPSKPTLTLVITFEAGEDAYDNARTIVEDSTIYGDIIEAVLFTPPTPAKTVDFKKEFCV